VARVNLGVSFGRTFDTGLRRWANEGPALCSGRFSLSHTAPPCCERALPPLAERRASEVTYNI
jgi:hypothetical protein